MHEHRTANATVTEDAVLKALDRPRKLQAVLQLNDPGGSTDAKALLMKMRDEGGVKFDIENGNWRRPGARGEAVRRCLDPILLAR